MELPGQAPWEPLLERLAAHWDRCRARGGRLWEVQAFELRDRGGAATLCAPRSCGEEEVQQRLWPLHLRRLTGAQAWTRPELLELGHWRQLRLDFVLAGFEKCGTSSVSHNLARHPQGIQFVPEVDPELNTDSQAAQDGNFFWFLGNRLLPPALLLEAFNAGSCCQGGQMPERAGSSGAGGGAGATGTDPTVDGRSTTRRAVAIRGERNPVYVFHRFIMKAISLVPHAKIVLVACDPIGWLHSAYKDTMNWYAGDPGDPPQPPLRAFALADAVPAPQSANGWYNLSRKRALFTRVLAGLLRLFGSSGGGRLHLLHRDSVDELIDGVGAKGVRASYNRLAGFLGLNHFPKDFAFERRNIGGVLAQHGLQAAPAAPVVASLCDPHERQVLRALQRYFRAEYEHMPAWLALLGGAVPPWLAGNASSCRP
mmetsp:Transcript_81545/g.253401  ORF Transcript_81545/g.253401 Transcript_81545/m.253401 type:complete len:426 (+) Transcript_81545:2-1279(+)